MKVGLFLLTVLSLSSCNRNEEEEKSEDINGFHRMVQLEEQKDTATVR